MVLKFEVMLLLVLLLLYAQDLEARFLPFFNNKFHDWKINSDLVDNPIKNVVEDANIATPKIRPLIGILSQPGDGDRHKFINQLQPNDPRRSNISYIAASYIKFVEAGGARAVPILYNEPAESLKAKFATINGILFPGGDTTLKDGPFYRTAEKLFKMAIEANSRGDYFPVWGTCLGFELLTVIISKNHSIMEHFEAERDPSPLIFVDNLAKQQNMFTWFPSRILKKISEKNLAMENHAKGISPGTWKSNKLLTGFFKVLTISRDKDEKEYVSTVAGRDFPVTGVQWHPEKNAFEWGLNSIPHSADAIQVTQSVANFFISEARKSSHRPNSREEEENILIYNYPLLFSAKDSAGPFDQSYVMW